MMVEESYRNTYGHLICKSVREVSRLLWKEAITAKVSGGRGDKEKCNNVEIAYVS